MNAVRPSQHERYIVLNDKKPVRGVVGLNFIPAVPPRVQVTDLGVSGDYFYDDYHPREVVVVGEGFLHGRRRDRVVVRVPDAAGLQDHIRRHFEVLASETTHDVRGLLSRIVREGITALGLPVPEDQS